MGMFARDSGISVGARAYRDPVLSKASLEAATMIRNATRFPAAQRFGYIMSRVRLRGPGMERTARAKVNALVRQGSSYDQAVFDAVRMTLADKAIDGGLLAIREALTRPKQATAGLGSAQDVGCAITGGVTAVGSFIAGIFGGGGGASAVGTGGGTLAESIGCNDAARAAQARNAALEAQAARDQLEAARVSAASAERVAFTQGKTYTTLAMFGAGTLLVFGLGYFVLKV